MMSKEKQIPPNQDPKPIPLSTILSSEPIQENECCGEKNQLSTDSEKNEV